MYYPKPIYLKLVKRRGSLDGENSAVILKKKNKKHYSIKINGIIIIFQFILKNQMR